VYENLGINKPDVVGVGITGKWRNIMTAWWCDLSHQLDDMLVIAE
jgi:hypothetical protein